MLFIDKVQVQVESEYGTYTVSSVGCINNLCPWSFRTVIIVDHAAKNNKMCQHLKRAVAKSAFTKEAPGRCRGANLQNSSVRSTQV